MRVVCSTLAKTLACLIILGTLEAHAYTIVNSRLNAVRWNQTSVNYYVHLDGSRHITDSGDDGYGKRVTEIEAIQEAFDTWNDVTGTDISFSYGGNTYVRETGNDGRNSIVWVEDWQSLSFLPPSSALAVTVNTFSTSSGALIDSDIHFNDDNYFWAVVNHPREFSVMDIENIATHEIGHFMGLDHSSDSPFERIEELYNATMYYASTAGETFRRVVNNDDIGGVRFLYPENNQPRPELDSVFPEAASNTDSLFELEVVGDEIVQAPLPRIYNSEYDYTIFGRIKDRQEVNGKDYLTISFDLLRSPPGNYDLVVSNSYNSSGTLRSALRVSGDGVFFAEKVSGGGGCGVLGSLSVGDGHSGIFLTMAGALLLLIGLRRRYHSTVTQ